MLCERATACMTPQHFKDGLTPTLKSQCVHVTLWSAPRHNRDLPLQWRDPTGRLRKWESAERSTRASCGVDGVVIVAHVTGGSAPPRIILEAQFRPPQGNVCIEVQLFKWLATIQLRTLATWSAHRPQSAIPAAGQHVHRGAVLGVHTQHQTASLVIHQGSITLMRKSG